MDETFYRKRRWTLILGTVVLMFAGVIYAWANLSSPLYDLGWTEDALTLNYTIMVLAFTAGGVVSGVLSKKLSLRARLIPSAALLMAGFWISSCLTQSSDIVLLYVSYGLLSGLGIGTVYNAVVSSVNLWFPDKKGLCAGILLTGFGLGSFFISLIAGRLMASGIMGWRTVYRVLGSVSGAVILAGAAFIRQPGENTRLPEASHTANAVSAHDYSPGEMIRTSAFWLMFFAHAFLAGIGNSVIPASKKIILSVNVTESSAILISSLLSVVNSVGRLSAGGLIDKFGLKAARGFACVVAVIGCALALAGLTYANAVSCTVGMFLCAYSYGFPATLTNTASLEYYGPKNYSLNYSLINADSAICAAFPTFFMSISTAVGKSYTGGFIFLIAVGALTFVMGLFTRRPRCGAETAK